MNAFPRFSWRAMLQCAKIGPEETVDAVRANA
jgi:hypothetical protein